MLMPKVGQKYLVSHAFVIPSLGNPLVTDYVGGD